MAKVKEIKEFILVKCRIVSVEPDSAQYKPTKPVVEPLAFVVVPVPNDAEHIHSVSDEETVLTLQGWAYLLAELRAAQKEIYG